MEGQGTTTTLKPGESVPARTEEQVFSPALRSSEYDPAAQAMAAKAEAMVKAKVFIAMQRPRSETAAEQRMNQMCMRTEFAKAAIYSKPQGFNKDGTQAYIEGPSIRFAEAILRFWGNVFTEASVVKEDEDNVTVHVDVMDLEANVSYGRDFLVRRTVDRRKADQSRELIKTRLNKQGATIYIYASTADEMSMAIAAMTSKVVRTEGLRIIPADIKSNCIKTCYKALDGEFKNNKLDMVKDLVERISECGVSVGQLMEYLGCDPKEMGRDQFINLTKIIQGLEEHETTWGEVMQGKDAGETPKAKVPPAATPPAKPATAAAAKPAPGKPAGSPAGAACNANGELLADPGANPANAARKGV